MIFMHGHSMKCCRDRFITMLMVSNGGGAEEELFQRFRFLDNYEWWHF